MENNDIKTEKISKLRSIGRFLLRNFKFISNSAIFGLVLTLAIFAYEQYEQSLQTKEIVDNLMDVQKSISTKYLGLFPDYLNRINDILENAQAKDSVIIFEDVLYYGFMSKPDEFKRMYKKLIELTDQNCHITIVYYNPRGSNFKRMVLDQYVATNYTVQMNMKRRTALHDSNKDSKQRREDYALICEQYFRLTRSDDPEEFRSKVRPYLKPISKIDKNTTGLDLKLETLYSKIDSVKSARLQKGYDEIKYDEICLVDFENMYREISNLLSDELASYGIELIPINENLPMSCWLVADKAILAFPSKYATDEIGFFSQDPAFSKYIHTMLNGLRGNYTQLDTLAKESE